MKARKYILIFILAFLASVIDAPAQNANRTRRIAAFLSVKRKNVYHKESFEITVTVKTENLRLGEQQKLLSVPPETKLKLGDFKAKPVKQSLRGSTIFEEHVYVYDAYAVSPGKVVMSPVLRVGILTRRRGFFGSSLVETTHDVPITPLTLNILPLPESPENFSGAVGQFDFSINVAPTDVAPGDIIKATMKIAGHGILNTTTPPAISPGRNFKAYNTKLLKDNDEESAVFEQVLIAQNTNATMIPSIDFTFFNPDQGKYITKSHGPFNLTFHEQMAESVEYYRPEDGSSLSKESPGSETGRLLGKQTSMKRTLREGLKRILDGTFFRKESETIAEIQGRLAPSSASLAMFKVPEGAFVVIISEYRNWAEIAWQNNRGWVPKRTLDMP